MRWLARAQVPLPIPVDGGLQQDLRRMNMDDNLRCRREARRRLRPEQFDQQPADQDGDEKRDHNTESGLGGGSSGFFSDSSFFFVSSASFAALRSLSVFSSCLRRASSSFFSLP